MGFRVSSNIASAVSTSTGGGGGYLNPSKIPSGGSVRFHITSDEPLSFFECWGESTDGSGVKPFRFLEDPSPADIEAEMGASYQRRPNRDGTGVEPVKAAIAFFVYNYDTESIQVMQVSQKGIIRELDQLTQMEDYADLENWDFVLGKEGSGIGTEYALRIVPIKKTSASAMRKAASESEESGADIKRLLDGGNPFKA